MPVDVVIVGAGPAGMSAALQLKRMGIDPVIFEKDTPGGLLLNANLVENYPGFPEPLSGKELSELIVTQLKKQDIWIRVEEVTGINYSDGVFDILMKDDHVESRVLVLASGTIPKPFTDCPVPRPCEARVKTEIRDILDRTSCEVVIIGAGDAAFDYALSLGTNNHVTILNRGTEKKCLALLKERVEMQGGIEYIEDATVGSIQKGGDGLLLTIENAGSRLEIYADYLVTAIGRVVKFDFLDDKLLGQMPELEEKGLLYRIGDIAHGQYRQTAICVGDGILSAMKIYDKLKGMDG